MKTTKTQEPLANKEPSADKEPSAGKEPSADKVPSAEVSSPCVRNCCLDHQDYCLGCFRHLDEITGWSGFSNEQKHQVLLQCRLRRKNRQP